MTDRPLPSPELLRKLLRYEPDTGKLYWRPRDRTLFMEDQCYKVFHEHFTEREAFTGKDRDGYSTGYVLGRKFFAHRVMWAMQTGRWPAHQIDHIDRDKSNNRWHNMREATVAQNAANRPPRKDSSSRYLGVSWSKRRRKWLVTICKNRVYSPQMFFSCEMEAAKAYDALAVEVHGEFANLNFPRILEECRT